MVIATCFTRHTQVVFTYIHVRTYMYIWLEVTKKDNGTGTYVHGVYVYVSMMSFDHVLVPNSYSTSPSAIALYT